MDQFDCANRKRNKDRKHVFSHDIQQKINRALNRKRPGRHDETLSIGDFVDVYDTRLKKWVGPHKLVGHNDSKSKFYIINGPRILVRNNCHIRRHYQTHDNSSIFVGDFIYFNPEDSNQIQEYFEVDQSFVIEEDGSDVRFRAADAKEMQGIFDNQVLEEVDSSVVKGKQVNLITARVTRIIKHDGTFKTRLVAHGFKDKRVLVDVSSPTPSRASLRIFLTLAASMGCKIKSFDVKQAFLQGLELEDDVFLKIKNDQYLPQYKDKVFKVRKCIYGLNDASVQWLKRFFNLLSQHGFIQSKNDKCFWSYKNSKGEIIGFLLVYVGDGVFFGTNDEVIKKVLDISKKVKFGQFNADVDRFLGVDTQQNSDFSIDIDCNKYAEKLVEAVNSFDIAQLKVKDQQLTPDQITVFRGFIGKASWLAQNVKPQLLCTISFLAAMINVGTCDVLKQTIKALQLVDTKTNKLSFKPLNLKKLHLMGFSDASLGNAAEFSTQGGGIVFLTDLNFWNVTSFYSRKLRRKTRSTFASELFGLSDLLDDLIYINNTLKDFFPLQLEVYIDSKSIVDNLMTSNPKVTEKKLLLELNAIRELLTSFKIKIYHCSGFSNPSDCLTKNAKFNSALAHMIATNKYDPNFKYDLTNIFLTEYTEETISYFVKHLYDFTMYLES